MSDINKAEMQKLIDARLEELGLTRIARMFALEHNVPRGTHKFEFSAGPTGPAGLSVTGPTGPTGPGP